MKFGYKARNSYLKRVNLSFKHNVFSFKEPQLSCVRVCLYVYVHVFVCLCAGTIIYGYVGTCLGTYERSVCVEVQGQLLG